MQLTIPQIITSIIELTSSVAYQPQIQAKANQHSVFSHYASMHGRQEINTALLSVAPFTMCSDQADRELGQEGTPGRGGS